MRGDEGRRGETTVAEVRCALALPS